MFFCWLLLLHIRWTILFDYPHKKTALFLIGVGFANIFPLIFSICVDRIPEKTNEISGLMTTAIVGAAIVPLFTGFAANFNPRYAFFVTLACLLYLTFLSLRTQKFDYPHKKTALFRNER